MPTHCRESGFGRVPDSSLPVKEVVLSGSRSSNHSTFTIKKSDVFYKFAFGNGDKPMDNWFRGDRTWCSEVDIV